MRTHVLKFSQRDADCLVRAATEAVSCLELAVVNGQPEDATEWARAVYNIAALFHNIPVEEAENDQAAAG